MTTEAKDDLTYLRQLAEAGSKAKLLGGRFYVFWGLLISSSYVGQWAILRGRFGLDLDALGWLWLGFGVIAVSGMMLLLRSIRRKPGQGTAGNRVETLVWRSFGTSVSAFALGAFLAVSFFGQPPLVWDFLMATLFAGYGAALLTTGVFADLNWIRLPGFGSIAAVAVVPVFAGTPELYLVAAGILIAVSVIPGFILLAGEPKSLPEES